MTIRRTDTDAAVALLERTDPVDPEQLKAELDTAAARSRVTRLIAADPARSPTPHSRLAHSPWTVPRPGRRASTAIAAAAGAAALAVAVAAVDGGAPAVQNAFAKPVRGALRALTPPARSILHVDFTTTEIHTGSKPITWHQDTYGELSPPYTSRTLDLRLPGTPPGTDGTSGKLGDQLYDPINHTIYAPPQPRPKPGSRTPSPAQQVQLYEPFMAQYISRLRAELASGAARVDGRTIVDRRAAIRIRFVDSKELDYVAADGSYVPIKTIQGTPSSADGETISVFHVFEYLPLAGHAKLLSLTAQHPTAHINTSLADFRAANAHLFPDG